MMRMIPKNATRHVRVSRLRAWASRSVQAVVASIVSLSLVAVSAAAQDTTGVGAMSGVVATADGQPAEGVRVCALVCARGEMGRAPLCV